MARASVPDGGWPPSRFELNSSLHSLLTGVNVRTHELPSHHPAPHIPVAGHSRAGVQHAQPVLEPRHRGMAFPVAYAPSCSQVYSVSVLEKLQRSAEPHSGRSGDISVNTLYLWRNEPTIVIGRCQSSSPHAHF
eukprot:3861382-Rhodomonas_salina.1